MRNLEIATSLKEKDISLWTLLIPNPMPPYSIGSLPYGIHGSIGNKCCPDSRINVLLRKRSAIGGYELDDVVLRSALASI